MTMYHVRDWNYTVRSLYYFLIQGIEFSVELCQRKHEKG